VSRRGRQGGRAPRWACARQGGFSLVTAIFVIVVLAALGAYLVTVGSTQQTATALQIQGVRAYFAALSAREWAAYEATASQASHDAICAPGGFTSSFALPGPGLKGFQAQVDCDDFANAPAGRSGPYQEGDDWYDLERIDVRAWSGSGPSDPDYVSRTLHSMVTTGQPLPP